MHRIAACAVSVLLFCVAVATVAAQTDSTLVQTELRAAGVEYQAGGLHRFFFGDHHRKLWAAPVEVPILDLNIFAGGLRPLKTGGGFQTKSLRFKSGDGREFAFRSMDKDPSKTLPPELRETIAEGVVRDQISSANPYAALVVPVLAEALGVLHASPKLVIMPNDDKLGEFRKDFANLLGFIEERPADGPHGEPGFAGADKIIGSADLFKELQEDNDDYVDSQAYLKARLLDVFLGDWDRHPDQWRWARFKEGKKRIWYPIPRDRDQAFVKLDGVFPSMAEKRYVIRQLENFYKDKPDIISLTYSGRHTDRRFLNRLSRDDFDAAQQEVADKLTNAVIERAVQQLPDPIYALEGADLTRRLKDRRDGLPKFAAQFYQHLAEYPEIVTSDKGEYAEIQRMDDDRVEVQIFKRDKDTGGKKPEDLLFDRVFNRKETKEIRLFLMGGKDKVMVSGQANNSILVRIIGGSDEDEIVDESKVKGRFLLLFPATENKTYVYDTRDGNQFIAGPSTKLQTGEVDSVVNFHPNMPLRPDYGHDAMPVPSFAYTPDDGVFLGAGMKYLFYGFRKTPYSSMLSFSGNYAFLTNAFRVRFFTHLVEVEKNLDFTFSASTTVPQEVTNFYGLGNDTPRDATLEKNEYYRVRSKEYLLRPMLHYKFSRTAILTFLAAYRRFQTQFREDHFVSIVQPYGSDIGSVLQFGTAFTYDSRNNPLAPWRGLFLGGGAIYYPKTFKNENDFTKTLAEARVFVSPFQPLSVAARVAGEKIFGTFPYYEAAYLGGSRSLRGFLRERFGGDASLLGSVEARLRLFRFKLLFPTSFGIIAGTDAGRVWVDEQSPGNWHSSATGGFWIAPIFPTNVFSFSLASSPEGLHLTIGGGFAF